MDCWQGVRQLNFYSFIVGTKYMFDHMKNAEFEKSLHID